MMTCKRLIVIFMQSLIKTVIYFLCINNSCIIIMRLIIVNQTQHRVESKPAALDSLLVREG